jgi:hypothetical protein
VPGDDDDAAPLGARGLEHVPAVGAREQVEHALAAEAREQRGLDGRAA